MSHTMNDRPCPDCGDIDGCHVPARIRDNRLSFEEFWEHQAEWSRATFGSDQERGPIGPMKHLALEVMCELIGVPRVKVQGLLETHSYLLSTDLMEFADLIFLVFDSCRRAGHSCEDLRRAVNMKLKINKARKWAKKENDEPVEHVREES